MKVNGGMALTGVLLIAAGSALSQGASAAEPAAPAEEHSGVNVSGEIEAGFRAFIERPPSYALPAILPSGPPVTAGGPLSGGQPAPIFNTDRDNRAKFEEYGNIRPGLYLELIDISAQTKDGEYFADFRGDNVGNNNQRFIFDWSKAGEHYGTYSWDQIPHLYSASAQSIWNGVGTNFLTTPVWIGNPGQNGQPANLAMYNSLQGNLETIDIAIKRDKFAALQRWTPNQNWDVRADYSHERREGTQLAGVVFGGAGPANQQIVQLPAPVADTTQNAKLSGQYIDDTPWGGKFNIRTSASVSAYQNDFDSFTFENPFSATNPGANPNCALTTTNNTYPRCGRVSLPPDNQAYNFAATTGVDLPNKSRYMGTVSYTMMRQNDEFIDRTINPNPALVANPPMPTDSADAKVDTLLFNNVLTTQLSKDVKSTLRYRYYDNDNNTPEIYWPQYVQEDFALANPRRRNLAYSYTKQNAAGELTWRADKNLTVGGSAGWEQYDRDRRAVDVTNEFMGKVFLDARIGEDTRLRSSYQYSERVYDNYDFQQVAYYQFNSQPTGVTNLMLRQLDLADRTRQKANVSLEWSGIEKLTITPTFGLRFDDYGTNPNQKDPRYITTTAAPGELGLTKDNTWNAGIELAYQIAPGASLMLAYVHENFNRDLFGGQGTTAYTTWTTGGTYFYSNMDENVDTYIASANVDLIPDTLELKLSYAYAHGKENWSAQPYTTSSQCLAVPNVNCQPFPAVKNDYQRLDAILKYRVDPEFVTKVGLIGDVFVKLRYSWEQNQVANWQNDWTSPYMYLVDGTQVRNISMAAVNPNYTAHFIAASLAVKW